jgi:predicted transcriptional regulator
MLSKSAYPAREHARAKREHEPFQALVDDRIMSLVEFSEVAGVSVATLRRLIKAGEGPPVTWMSSRRCGIRVRHGREWLDACLSSPEAG